MQENKPSVNKKRIDMGQPAPARRVYGKPAMGAAARIAQQKAKEEERAKLATAPQPEIKEERNATSCEVNKAACEKPHKTVPEKKVKKTEHSLMYKLGKKAGHIYLSFLNYKEKRKSKKNTPSDLTLLLNEKKMTKLFICLTLVMLLVISGSLLYLYRPFPADNGIPSDVRVYYNFNGKTKSVSYSGGSIFRDNGEIYVNMTEVYAGLGMNAIGDNSGMKYSMGENEYMILKNRSEVVDMNGESITLPGKVYIEGRNVFAPVALIEYYTKGVDVYYNTESERLYISRVIDTEKSNSIQTVYVDFELVLHKSLPLAPITEPDI